MKALLAVQSSGVHYVLARTVVSFPFILPLVVTWTRSCTRRLRHTSRSYVVRLAVSLPGSNRATLCLRSANSVYALRFDIVYWTCCLYVTLDRVSDLGYIASRRRSALRRSQHRPGLLPYARARVASSGAPARQIALYILSTRSTM